MRIVFYDGECGLCNWAVAYALLWDRKRILFYAPQNGPTFEKELGVWRNEHKEIDSIIVIDTDDKEPLIYSKAIFRILWHMGSFFRIIGIFSFLPDILFWPLDCIYKWVAKNRKGCSLFLQSRKKELDQFHDQFLP